jgi:adenylate kinase family enzyme
MIGNTKAGKTTSGHFLAQQHLQGIQGDTGAVYECRETRFKRALIGRFEAESETEIPNFFYPEQNDIRV